MKLEKIKEYPNWINWKIDKDNPKIPKNSRTGGNAQNNNPSTWSTYETAKKFGECVGFEFGNSPVIGIDIDHCINSKTGKISELAEHVISVMKSYTEFSQSGTGLHILALVTDKAIFQNRKIAKPENGFEEQGIEFYFDNKYFALTENCYNNFDIEERQSESERIFEEYFTRVEAVKTKISSLERNTFIPDDLDNIALQTMLSKPKLKQLYEGDYSVYPSQSEADLALCGVLAWYFNKNAYKIDYYFRHSGLMRPKWDEKHKGNNTYGEISISRAIANCTGEFNAEMFSKRGRELYKFAVAQLVNYDSNLAVERFKKKTSEFFGTLSLETLKNIWENAKNSRVYQAKIQAVKSMNNFPDLEIAYTDFNERANQLKLLGDEKARAWKGAIKEIKKQTQQEQQAEKEKRPPKRHLTAVNIERKIKELGINLSVNAISLNVEVDNIPEDNDYVTDSFKELSENEKKKQGGDLLPVMLQPMLKDLNFTFSESYFNSALSVIANAKKYNPVKNMLESHTWDGVDRLEQLYKIMGIEGNSLYRTYVKKWLWQAVAMALNDDSLRGNDFVLTLQGEQGSGKTEFARIITEGTGLTSLFKEGAIIDTRNKDKIMEATQKWICEIGELDATIARGEIELKSFITANSDEYRQPYGVKAQKYPRRTAFIATINPDRILQDTAGGTRRWAIMRIGHIDTKKMRELKKTDFYVQLWRQIYECCYMVNPDGYRLSDTDREQLEKSNLLFSKHKKGELEILENLDFNAPLEKWNYRSPTWFIREAELKNNTLTPKAIGEAINKIMKYDTRIKSKKGKNNSLYLLPPVKQNWFEETLYMPEQEQQEQETERNSQAETTPQECWNEFANFFEEKLPDSYKEKYDVQSAGEQYDHNVYNFYTDWSKTATEEQQRKVNKNENILETASLYARIAKQWLNRNK
ncbi:MAG: hypothetical protein IJP69_03405 [Synergistaceae bacterium]|nr:hypothetical protein [Synergistaceae bacterium]